MNVAVTYDTLSRWGGQELVTYAMVKALSESGFTVDVILLFNGGIDSRINDIPARRIVSAFDHDPNLPIRGLSRNIITGIMSLGYDLTINTVYHVMIWPFDIGYLNNPGTYMPPYRLRRRILLEFNRVVLPILGPRLLLANSKWTLNQLPYRPRLSGVLYPPVMPHQCGSVSKEEMVVTVGRIAPDKRIIDAVKIMEAVYANYPKASFYVIGLPYNQEYFRLVKEQAKHVEFILDASEETKWDYLCRAKVLLHTAINEHFGLVAAEAQYAGVVPVVHKSGGLWSDIVGYGEFGLGYLSNNEAVESIIRLLSNGELFNAYSMRVKEHSILFTYEAFKSRLISYVKSLIKP
ncbi:glycosyltransferase family 4 protein [Caldivirga maquilingensis]|uniref:Glycosyl transferase group 1 n=1 Tax=Caldivirga maquilingensis (strain ATCC 700844 / DSM 13496 / JCM 10307 / IC-167) TaxID=397948 RepID=A8MAJ2_CALMQ|nr:glycosyltransferase family 4 protein [Caldivirga maquilingensis]ABW02569.1 glycosyl transferase group 1 [Caldivirga maquilingensis IC-167]